MQLPPLFSLAWQEGLRHVPESAMAVTVHLYREGTKVYDVDTDEWVIPKFTLYQGKARVQPLRSTARRESEGNTQPVLPVLVSIPVSENSLNIRPGQKLSVLEAPLNPSLTGYEGDVYEVVDSGNILERTFFVQVNQETVATDSGGGSSS